MASSNSKHNSKIQHTIIETAPKATLLMLLAGLFILIALTFVIRGFESPIAYSVPAAYASLYCGVLAGGCYCGLSLNEKRAFTCSLLSALIFCLLILIAKAIISAPNEKHGVVASLITHLLIFLFSVTGGLIGNRLKINKELKKRKKHYRSTR